MKKKSFKDDLSKTTPAERGQRDLAAIVHLSEDGVASLAGAVRVNINLIKPNPAQPRRRITPNSVQELASSIREKGILQPLVLRKTEDGYQLIAGERRLVAAREAGLTEVPAVVTKADGPEMLELALIENLQREDLQPLEEAEGLKMLAEKYDYTQEQLAKRIGKSQPAINESLRLNALPEEIKEEIRTSDKWKKSQLLPIVRQGSKDKIAALWEKVKVQNSTVKDIRRRAKGKALGRPRNFEFRYQGDDKSFTVLVRFKKTHAEVEEVAQALKKAADSLLEGESSGKAP
jgi:ParB family chromosome partitioning protein